MDRQLISFHEKFREFAEFFHEIFPCHCILLTKNWSPFNSLSSGLHWVLDITIAIEFLAWQWTLSPISITYYFTINCHFLFSICYCFDSAFLHQSHCYQMNCIKWIVLAIIWLFPKNLFRCSSWWQVYYSSISFLWPKVETFLLLQNKQIMVDLMYY